MHHGRLLACDTPAGDHGERGGAGGVRGGGSVTASSRFATCTSGSAGSHVLQGVASRCPAGAVTALLGRNGVGKTTTLRALLGLVPARGARSSSAAPTSRGEPTHRIVQRGVGYVPEDRDVFAALTVAENLELAVRNGSRRATAYVYELFPELRERAPRSGPGRSRAASSRWSRSPGRS